MIKYDLDIHSKTFEQSDGRPQIFHKLSEKAVQEILENAVLRSFEAGQTLVQQGDEPTHVYFIIEGRIRTLRTNIDGDEVTISMLETGETCMEAVIFMGGPSPIIVQIAENARLMLLPSNFIKKFVLKNPQFATNLLEIVTQNYRTAIHQIDAMAIKTPVQRVGYYFLQKHVEQGADNRTFELPFKKATIANHLGITPETFSRALGQIKKMGVEIEGEKIYLKEACALCHFCDMDSAYQCTSSNKEDCQHCTLHKKGGH